MKVDISVDKFALKRVFTLSRGSRSVSEVLTVTLRAGGCVGRGECVPYARYGESLASVARQIESLASALRSGMDRADLQTAISPGAARNAIDCALWDLQAKQCQVPVWQLAGLREPKSVTTAFTLSLATPEEMRDAAIAQSGRPILKIKLGGNLDDDSARLSAVRDGAPDAKLIVDANEGWDIADYNRMSVLMFELGVALVEQPLPAREDGALCKIARPVPVCADESCHARDSLPSLQGKYDTINIKLDKTGGLTEALALRDKARAAGYSIMVGCMVSSSLSMAPAMLVAQGAQWVDLDGPLLLREDRHPAIQFEHSTIYPAADLLWG